MLELAYYIPIDPFYENIFGALRAFTKDDYKLGSDFLQSANHIFDTQPIYKSDDNAYTLSMLNFDMGEHFRVLELLLHIENRNPYPDFYFYLENSYCKVGKNEGAEVYYDSFVPDSPMYDFAQAMKAIIAEEFEGFQDPYDGDSESGESDVVMDLAGDLTDDLHLE